MKKIALFPGSFDPFTVGHESIVKRALPLFDTIIIGIGVNEAKHDFFPLLSRVEWVKSVFAEDPSVQVTTYSGLTIEFCKKIGAQYLIRGLRTSADFEFERAVGQVNKVLDNRVETIFLLTRPEHSFISSSIVRDVYKNGGDIRSFIPVAMHGKL
ncbi:MAG TPA: pantetheine-phosphate adenylyltransferase [Bacteroidales bacterium]|nr:pantetheine-phosphate adenylyltransferase [Bacteroidales bacterium]HOE03625.1 pantetheine-phosphate adenylyltransferase [Bacteroidales bacterium]HQL69311.1 pantetheine-phosphate adenylyltransferase [Bacteroidales bacterium]